MEKRETVTETKISNLDELTKVLSVKRHAQEQLLVVMQTFGIGKIVRNLKFEKVSRLYFEFPLYHARYRAFVGKNSCQCHLQ